MRKVILLEFTLLSIKFILDYILLRENYILVIIMYALLMLFLAYFLTKGEKNENELYDD